ncbi:MAG: TetR family transcriptional regulator [Deltaproteobacteria bacterium]|nr:TetR family transcriptional regulator [Deltaproteobacteria bacterium]
MARTKDKADIRKFEILEHFQQVLAKEGFEGASIAKIAKQMGTHPSLLIHYFSTKEEMIIELVDFILEKYESMALQKSREILNPEQRLNTLLDTIFGVDWISLVDSSAFYACYYLSFRNRKVKERLEKLYKRFKEYLVNEINLCVSEGLIKESDPEKDADFIISLVEGLSFYRNITGGKQKYRELGSYLKEKALQILTKS